MRINRIKIESGWVVNAAATVGNGDDLRAKLADQSRCNGSSIAVPLHHDRCALEVEVDLACRFANAEDCTARRRLVTALRAAERNRLTSDDTRNGWLLYTSDADYEQRGGDLGGPRPS